MKSIVLAWRPALLTCTLLVLGCDGSDKELVGPGDGLIRAAVAAAPTQLAFTVQPTTTTAGAAIAPAVQVTAQDASGNTVTTFTGNVTVAIGANPGGGTLAGTKTKKAVSGVATFANLSIKKSGTGYTLQATSGALAGGTSSAFDIISAPASKLAFTAQPTSRAAGETISPAVQVSALDAFNNTATTFVGNITVALRSCPANSILSGTVTVAAVGGIASFADLSLNKSGNCGLKATSGSFSANSVTFVVGPSAPVLLVFQTQPAQTKAGVVITPAVKVTARDQFGNTASGFNGAVTMSIGTGPVGATLLGTTTVTAASGTASFTTLVLQKIGSYTLQATAAGLTSATSNGFIIKVNSPTHLAFTVQPSNTAPGAQIAPPIQVTVRDAYDNTVPINGSVTLAIGSNPGGGTLSGTKTRSASTGVATFANLSINNAGTGYTLGATLGNLPSATSAPFNIGSGNPPTQLAFSAQPSNTASGAAIAPPVQVTTKDAQGNPVSSFTGNVTVSIGTNPSGGTLSGTLTASAVSGVATFSNLSINNAGNGYSLQASSAGLTTATSVAFDITSGAATQLVFTVQPTNTSAGNVIAPAVEVTVQDAQGNTVTDYADSLTIAIAANPGGGTLSGTTTVSVVSGVATFSDLSINNVGAGYTLQATSGALAAGTSAAFDIMTGGNFWTAQSSMSGVREGLGASTINGTLYAVGGYQPGNHIPYLATLEAYDPATDTWTTKAPMPTGRRSLGVAAVNGILYAVGGYTTDICCGGYQNTLEAYDPATDTWTTKASMPTERTNLAVAAINGILYAVGGDNTNGFLATLEAYDPATNTWVTKASMPTARANLAVAAVNGILYAVGGMIGSDPGLTTLEAYDPATDTWTTRASMPTARYNLSAAAINGTLCAVGGYGGGTRATLEAYDPITNTWAAKASMPTARFALAAAAINGTLYAIGGTSATFNTLATLEAYHE